MEYVVQKSLITMGVLMLSSSHVAVADPAHYQKGWIANVEYIGSNSSIRVGSFIEKDNPYRLDIHRRIDDFTFLTTTPAISYEGFFEAKEDGFYTFIADISLPPTQYMTDRGVTAGELTCSYSLFLEGKEVLNFNSGVLRTVEGQSVQVIGNHDLKKGLYNARQYVRCVGSRDTTDELGRIKIHHHPRESALKGKVIKMKQDPAEEVVVSLMVREPNTMTPRLMEPTDVVHEVAEG